MKLNDYYQFSSEQTARQEELMLRRPISDDALFIELICSSQPDFSSPVSFSSASDPTDREAVSVYDGISSWIAHPVGGLGTPFDSQPVTIKMTKFSELGSRIYVKYRWIKGDGTANTQWATVIYPSTSEV